MYNNFISTKAVNKWHLNLYLIFLQENWLIVKNGLGRVDISKKFCFNTLFKILTIILLNEIIFLKYNLLFFFIVENWST